MKKFTIYLLLILFLAIPSFVFAKYPATWKEATGEDPWVAEQRMRAKNVQLYVDVANKIYGRMLEAYRSSDPDFHLLGGIYLSNNSCDFMFSGGGNPNMSLADRQCAKLLTPEEYKDIYGVDLYSTNWWKEDRINLALGGVPFRTVVGKGNAPLIEGDIFEQMLPKAGNGTWPNGPKLGNAFDPNLKLPIPAPTWEQYQKYGNMDDPNLPMWAARFGWPYKAEEVTSTKFQIGDTARTAANVNVRATSNGNIVGRKVVNSYGTVLEGPQNVGGYIWWKVDFHDLYGWSAENYLVKVSSTDNVGATPSSPSTPAAIVPGCVSRSGVPRTTGYSRTTGKRCDGSDTVATVQTGRPTTATPSYLGSAPVERYPALSAAAIARAQNSSDPHEGLLYKQTSSQALSAEEKTVVHEYTDDNSDPSIVVNPLQFFSPCGSLMTEYARTGSVIVGRGSVYKLSSNVCQNINQSFIPDYSSFRTYACENFLYKSRVVGRATFAFTCKAGN
ncbi:MAG: hypothetical protein WC783_04640 [Candidatus Paceibacterota bacterium]|jgi:hypothetical protein